MTRIGTFGLGATAALLLSACQPPELVLSGTRYDVDTPLSETLPADEVAGAATPLRLANGEAPPEGARAISLPAPQSVSSWPQRGLSPSHKLPHLALGTNLTPIWTADIGAGNDRRHRITADPVVEGGRIFTLDAESQVAAHSTSGQPLWAVDLTPPGERRGQASGGGLAIYGGKLFVSSGWGTVSALDPATGALLWRQKIESIGTAAPTVVGDLLYIVGRDNRGWAIRASDGKVIWTIDGERAPAGYVGGPGPVVDNRIAVLPFAGGQVVAVLRQSGVRSWSGIVGGQREVSAYATVIRDVGADPVLDGGKLYASNAAGKLAAIDAGRGDRIWTAQDGTMGTVLPVGGSLFMVSDANELVRLDAATGERIWGTPMPNFLKRKVFRRKAIHAHFGPILAGGRLIVASDDGVIRGYDPVSGALVGQVSVPGGAASNPIVVGGVLYVVTQKGKLMAFH